MKNLIKTLTLATAGLVVGTVVLKRVSKLKNWEGIKYQNSNLNLAQMHRNLRHPLDLKNEISG